MIRKPILKPVEGDSYVAPPKDQRILNLTSIINVLILSIAGVAITWCSYQATRWSGIQAFSMAETNAYFRQAQEEHELATQGLIMDEMVVVNFVNAVMANDSLKMKFYTERVRPELANALRQWLRQDPLHNKSAPPHPGATDAYKKVVAGHFSKIDSFRERGNSSWRNAEHANRTADNYVLITVVFSVVMFLSGVAPKVHIPKLTFGLSITSAIIALSMLTFLMINMPVAQR